MRNNKSKRKKKGFTLIELIIVLSVLAIIALIAVPNFAKIKQNALASADENSCSQITSMTQMAVAEGIIKVGGSDGNIEFSLNVDDSEKINIVEKISGSIKYGEGYELEDLSERYAAIKNPQSENFDAYKITIDAKGKTKVSLVELEKTGV